MPQFTIPKSKIPVIQINSLHESLTIRWHNDPLRAGRASAEPSGAITDVAGGLKVRMPEDKNPLVEGICAAALAAGAEIMSIYAGDFDVQTKADQSPVTAADEAAERIILEHLAVLTPGIPVIAEESVAAGVVPDVSGGTFWLVDPLDGTKEFVSRNGEFTVNIALIEGRRPTLGVVYAPARDRLFYASGPGQAFAVEQGAPARNISVRKPGPDGLIVVASRSHRDAKTDEYLKKFNVKEIRAGGSSLKFCLVATGEADFYPRLGRTMEWDIAAGHAVLTGAGGNVKTLEGEDFLYNKSGFENGFFVARGFDD